LLRRGDGAGRVGPDEEVEDDEEREETLERFSAMLSA